MEHSESDNVPQQRTKNCNRYTMFLFLSHIIMKKIGQSRDKVQLFHSFHMTFIHGLMAHPSPDVIFFILAIAKGIKMQRLFNHIPIRACKVKFHSLGRFQGPLTQRGSMLSLMYHCHHLEILHFHSSFKHCKLCSQH